MATATRRNTKPSPTPAEARREAESETRPNLPANRTSAPTTRVGGLDLVPMDQEAQGIAEDAGRGLEQMRPQDMAQPRLKLIQGVSEELQTYDGLRAGQFFHTGQEAILGDSFIGVPLHFDIRYILWRPRNVDGGGILARADDGVHWDPPNTEFRIKLSAKDGGHEVVWTTRDTVAQSGLQQFGTYNPNVSGSPPAATLMYNYLIGFPEEPELMPAVLTFQRSATKPGQDFNLKLRSAMKGKYALYQNVFRFESFIANNKAGDKFFNIRPVALGRIDASNPILRGYKDWFDTFRSKRMEIKDVEQAQDQGEVIEGEVNREGAPAY